MRVVAAEAQIKSQPLSIPLAFDQTCANNSVVQDSAWMNRKILVMGLPGSGKTTLTRALAPILNAVVFDNDEVRANINRDLGFSVEDRVE